MGVGHAELHDTNFSQSIRKSLAKQFPMAKVSPKEFKTRAQQMAYRVIEPKLAAMLSAPAAGDQPPEAGPLPDGWAEAIDKSTGRSYYWQKDDPAMAVTWERPRP